MKRASMALWIVASVVVSLAGGYAFRHPRPVRAAAQASTDKVIFLDQGWTPEIRESYYHISQGTTVMPYDIFLNLEAAGTQELFRSDANSERYGLTPDPANPQWNPDGLPIGLGKTVTPDGPWKGEDVGINCATCHNTELFYQGKRVRIDGGVGNHFDLEAYVFALDDAVQETLKDSAKFDRLAARMGVSSADAKSELRKRFETNADRIHSFRTTVLLTPYPWGPSRMDAIGLIVARVTSVAPEILQNWSAALAPTKPPFLWNSPQGTWTQWRGVQQDPINRNLTETMGVFMSMNLTAKSPEAGLFQSNARLKNLEEIEGWLNHLAPPKWPEEAFGKIDRAKAAQGKKLFEARCAECHNSYPYTWTAPNKYGKRFLEVGLVPESYVGTDPMQFQDVRPYVQTAHLAPYLPGPLKDKPLIPGGYLYVGLQESILHAALLNVKQTPEEAIEMHGYRELPTPRPSEVPHYKAAPRDGVWATPPFMHNGSVPNLYEMLVPAAERTKKFCLGRDFDPVKVGVDTSCKSGTYMVDTSLIGSSNRGHSFENAPLGNGVIGPLLTEDERWAIVEYLKSIPEEAGRVTPFGGPPNAVTGHAKWGEQPKEPEH
ncbi:MAG: di-heme-cytochrome C peroxidase [Candidatus Acidiferrales bacterium]